jgi:hypothetical protein
MLKTHRPSFPASLRTPVALVLLAALGGAAQAQPAQVPAAAAAAQAPEMDRPTARAYWKAEWYNEGSAPTAQQRGKQGGPWNAAFRRDMLDAAARERAKWGRMIPGVTQTGTHLGVYRSLDRGTSWARFGTGMPLVSVSDIYLSADATLVRAATFGRGFWDLTP